MIDLGNKNISYVVLSSDDKLNDVVSILYAKNYQVIPIQSYFQGRHKECIIAYGVDNDELRNDMIFILNHFHEDYAIIKYIDEDIAKKIFRDGSEKPMSISLYNTDDDKISYLYNGMSFSFIEEKRYWKPSKKEDFKTGMLVEYFNKNKWHEKEVINPILEYDNFFKLLIKYDKVRVASK